jgi:chaperonin GroES
MNLQPLNGHVILRLVEAEEKTKGGLYVPDAARERPAEGIIEALPTGSSDELAIGDRVLYKKHAGEELSVDGKKIRIVPEGDLLAKFVISDPVPS